MAFLLKVNDENIRHSANRQSELGYRVNTGVYFYYEPVDASHED